MRISRQESGRQSEARVHRSKSPTVRGVETRNPVEIRMSTQLRAAGEAYDWDSVSRILDNSSVRNTIIFNASISAAVKCGHFAEGWALFLELSGSSFQKTPISYRLGVTCLGRLHRFAEAERLWYHMMTEGIDTSDPLEEALSYLAIISAAGHTGLVSHAVARFREFESRGVAEPQLQHYGAVLNACRRAGDAEMARTFLAHMRSRSVQPSVVVYTSAMGAHKAASLFEIGKLHAARDADGVLPNEHYVEEHVTALLGVGVDLRNPNIDALSRTVAADPERAHAAAATLTHAFDAGIRLKKLVCRAEAVLQACGFLDAVGKASVEQGTDR